MPIPRILFLILALFMSNVFATEVPVVDHAMEVQIDPTAGTLAVTDRLTLPPERETVDLVLHEGLSPRVLSGDATLTPLGRDEHLEALRLQLSPAAKGVVTLGYGGPIRHGLSAVTEGMGRERQETAGTIGPEGVFLDGASGWYPRVPGTHQRVDLKVTLPPGWQAISQGAGPQRDGFTGSAWTETRPQDDIYLVAAPFQLYRDPHSQGTAGAEAQVWLRAPDERLAADYLAATREYLDLYGRLIGPYPYAKFALVENFWETGYGMPSFTLLGPRVLRLPFIITSSYPHEVLHNWWGNSVYVDARTGNWSEGLTTYLADHLLKEREGQGAAYRRDSLQAYADFVKTDRDFPLSQFRGRHGEASQAIGYGKAAMFFHNLRLQLGDAAFVAGLRRFYADHQFRAAGYADLRRAFETVSGRDLGDYFTAWTTRTGAARLALSEVQSTPTKTGYQVTGRISQIQLAPLPLAVPVVVHPVDGPPVQVLVDLKGRKGDFTIDLPTTPLRLAVDPEFDTFRTLAPGESPVALSGLFGAGQGLILLPGAAEPGLLAAYRELATAWQAGHPGWSVTTDQEVQTLPQDRPVWLLGWENRFLGAFASGGQGFALDPERRTLSIGGTAVDTSPAGDISLVLTRERDGQALGWLASGEAAALPGLARKVPHYGKYGYLVFTGTAPDNRLKGQWPPNDSPLIHWFGDQRPTLLPVPRASLAEVGR